MAECIPYVQSNYDQEEKIHKQLVVLEYQFRDHYEYFKSQVEAQLMIIDQLWVLMQRHHILSKRLPTSQVYDEDISQQMLCEISNEIHSLVLKIYSSNGKIRHRFKTLTCSCAEFDKLVKQVDLSVFSPYIGGSPTQKPLAYFIELFKDVYQYFDSLQAKMSCYSNYLYPNNEKALDKYKELIQQSAAYDEFLKLSSAFCQIPLSFKKQ